jgi:hypothetical protein
MIYSFQPLVKQCGSPNSPYYVMHGLQPQMPIYRFQCLPNSVLLEFEAFQIPNSPNVIIIPVFLTRLQNVLPDAKS